MNDFIYTARKTVFRIYKEFDDKNDFSYSTFSKLAIKIKNKP